MTLYRTNLHNENIEECEYERVTASYAIKADGRRDALRTEYERMHLTREAAIEHLHKELLRSLEVVRAEVVRKERRLAEFAGKYLDAEKGL